MSSSTLSIYTVDSLGAQQVLAVRIIVTHTMLPLARCSHCHNVSLRTFLGDGFVSHFDPSLPLPHQVPWSTPLISFPLSTRFCKQSFSPVLRSVTPTKHLGLGGAVLCAHCHVDLQASLCPPCQGLSASTSSSGHTPRQVLQAPLSPSEYQKRVLMDEIICSFNSVLEMCAHRGIRDAWIGHSISEILSAFA